MTLNEQAVFRLPKKIKKQATQAAKLKNMKVSVFYRKAVEAAIEADLKHDEKARVSE